MNYHPTRSHWLELTARAGYATKGVVYFLAGALAALAASGQGGSLGGKDAAIHTLERQPAGDILVGIAAVGLAAYALWRFVQALLDPEHKGSDAKGIVTRIGYAASGVVHGALAVLALQLARGESGGGDEGRTYLSSLLRSDAGQIVVIGAGLAVMGAAVYQLYRAITGSFERELETGRMTPARRTWAMRAGRFGLAAHSVVFAIIGYALARAGMHANAGEAKGMAGALREVAIQSPSRLLLIALAVGLALYGVFQVVLAKYRRIPAQV